MNINCSTIFSEFYHTRFFVLFCLNVFTLLLSLRFDQTLKCSYWIIFLPLWLWKLTATFGFIIGTISWCRLAQKYERDNFVQFKAMILSYITNIILFIFELLICQNLQEQNMLWTLCLIPLLILSIISLPICIWSIRHGRSYEMEFLCSINLLQFIFVSLRLDNFISWSWGIVFVPLWITMFIALIGLLYLIIITIIISRNSQAQTNSQRENKWTNTVAYAFFILFLIIFEIILTVKLEAYSNKTNLNYLSTSIPLYFAYFSLMFLSLNRRSGNIWWFGMRRDFCELFLLVCPFVQTYGNVQLKLGQSNGNDQSQDVNATPTVQNSLLHFEHSQPLPQLNQHSKRFRKYNKKFLHEFIDIKQAQKTQSLGNFVILDVPD